MDSSDHLVMARQASKRDLQGPRPTPLKVRKDSYKIKKPPVAPPAPQNAPPQHRPPVIIYMVSPNVVHTTPGDFMSVVQRLTGASSSAAVASSSSVNAPASDDAPREEFSPAARLAVFEKAAQRPTTTMSEDDDALVGLGGGLLPTADRQRGLLAGILSPGAGFAAMGVSELVYALQWAESDKFVPSTEPSSWQQKLSAGDEQFHAN
ncbi:hypothetical protein Cni_G13239 [Canna indica]|uniref:VQ domain-containing protein n=1 Tax=Canna indica TaxID=4628 RepID=A0AAQ3K970_9LILI|nr:hypothetical protein Cni_G13239 [Canna indica]